MHHFQTSCLLVHLSTLGWICSKFPGQLCHKYVSIYGFYGLLTTSLPSPRKWSCSTLNSGSSPACECHHNSTPEYQPGQKVLFSYCDLSLQTLTPWLQGHWFFHESYKSQCDETEMTSSTEWSPCVSRVVVATSFQQWFESSSQPAFGSHHLPFSFCLIINAWKDIFLSMHFWSWNKKTQMKQSCSQIKFAVMTTYWLFGSCWCFIIVSPRMTEMTKKNVPSPQ